MNPISFHENPHYFPPLFIIGITVFRIHWMRMCLVLMDRLTLWLLIEPFNSNCFCSVLKRQTNS